MEDGGEKLEGMKPVQPEQKKQEVLAMCICKTCPSWAECGEEGGFCLESIGKSGCIKEERGCVCGSCPATPAMNLKHSYYCAKGSEKEQGGN